MSRKNTHTGKITAPEEKNDPAPRKAPSEPLSTEIDATAQDLPPVRPEEKKRPLDTSESLRAEGKQTRFLKSVDEKELKKRKKESSFSLFGPKPKAESRMLPEDTERFHPSPTKGLTAEEVKRRVEDGLTNAVQDSTSRTYRQIFFENICNYFNMVSLAIAIVLIVFGRYTEAMFLWAAVGNTVIGIVQGIKAKKTVEKLKLVTAQNVKIIRDGKAEILPSDRIVLDDIYVLNNGDQIPTDSILEDGSLEVNESLLTGESVPVKKGVGDTIYAGSFIVSGSAIVRANQIGRYNYAMGIQARAKEFQKPQSEIVRSLNKIILVIGILIIPFGLALFLTQYYFPSSTVVGASAWERASEAVGKTAGSVIGMIPSGMYLLTSVALCTGVVSLARKNTLVQDLYCIEMLARVNTLCLDKTGTLTDGTMKCTEVLRIDKTADLDKLVGSYLNAFSESNQTSIALSNAYPIRNDYKAEATIPFSSARKYSAVMFYYEGTFLLGAPEYLYKSKDKTLSTYIAEKQSTGMRVVMLAKSDGRIVNGEVMGKVTPVALFVLEDHIRSEAPATIRWFVENGVKIKIISGDNPLTVSEIAKKCGVPNAERAVSLEGLSAQEVAELVDQYAVFGRVSPEQKAAIIKQLKKEGRTVGMTGDGVNDILAMKQADCSIAMANGSSSARNVAHLVLLDSNFAHLPAVVAEGRRVVNNIQRSSSMFLMKTIFTMFFTLVVLTTYLGPGHHGISYPFHTNNIMIMEFCGIGLPSTLLALQKNDAEITGHFTKNAFSRAIPGALCLLIAISINYLFQTYGLLGYQAMAVSGGYAISGIPFVAQGTYTLEEVALLQQESFTTLCSVSMAIVSLAMVYCCCTPFNGYRLRLYLLSLILALLLLFVLPYLPPIGGNPDSVIALNFSTEFTGIDFRYLTEVEWLLLAVYAVGGTGLLAFLIDCFASLRGEKPKNAFYQTLHEHPKKIFNNHR